MDYVSSEPLLKEMECHLVCVGKNGSEHENALRDAESKLVSAGYKVDAELLEGNPNKVISELIHQDGSDLLVMGAYGHSRIRQMIVGSTTSAMLQNTKRPVLLFR